MIRLRLLAPFRADPDPTHPPAQPGDVVEVTERTAAALIARGAAVPAHLPETWAEPIEASGDD